MALQQLTKSSEITSDLHIFLPFLVPRLCEEDTACSTPGFSASWFKTISGCLLQTAAEFEFHKTTSQGCKVGYFSVTYWWFTLLKKENHPWATLTRDPLLASHGRAPSFPLVPSHPSWLLVPIPGGPASHPSSPGLWHPQLPHICRARETCGQQMPYSWIHQATPSLGWQKDWHPQVEVFLTAGCQSKVCPMFQNDTFPSY